MNENRLSSNKSKEFARLNEMKEATFQHKVAPTKEEFMAIADRIRSKME